MVRYLRMRALNLLRNGPHYRKEAFAAGLKAAGYTLTDSLPRPQACDALLIWNRYGAHAEFARMFEAAGAKIFVAENSPLPVQDAYSIARDHVAMTGGLIYTGLGDRFAKLGINLLPWRSWNGGPVIMAQRQIGHPTVASPANWAETVRAKIGGRIRQHPGTGPAVPLEEHLADASCVVTWSSAAAIRALILGVPVWHAHPAFVGAPASRMLTQWRIVPHRMDDAARLQVMQRLAWAVWTLDEITAGEPFKCKS